MDEAKQVWEAYIRAWNRHDIEGIMAVVANDFIYDERPMTMREPLVGKKAFADYLIRVLTAFPDLSIEILSLDAGEKMAWSESLMRGTQTGKMNKLPASNRQMVVRVACAFEVADGRLIHERLYWDCANTLRQFGAVASFFGILAQSAWRPRYKHGREPRTALEARTQKRRAG